MSFQQNYLDLKSKMKKSNLVKESEVAFVKPPKPSYADEWASRGLTLIENKFGYVFMKKQTYPFSYLHGTYTFEESKESIKQWMRKKVDHPLSPSKPKLMFFDTETTGLKGAGTYIFLSGQLEILSDRVELHQYVMANHDNEAAFLYETGLWKNDHTVVSYNGKSFDWPQLQTRWVFHRSVLPPLPDIRQLDLLHSSRRIWKNALERFPLTEMEKQVIGFVRKDDIPGHLAPMIYLDAIKSGYVDTLMKVLKHNEWDLLSLISLYGFSTDLLLREKSLQDGTITATNIGKWFYDLQDYVTSKEHFEEIGKDHSKEEAAIANYYLGLQFKKEKQYVEAISYFRQSINYLETKQRLDAWKQLAILLEHKFFHYNEVNELCEKAIQYIEETTNIKQSMKTKLRLEWVKRKARVNRKQK
ncbi:ribonuclease H-like domain-containing protein [Paenisporosarcina cavernae]|uniref:Exonuclease n=1 Tax=Paenisporosarcina cavernae TaxID=2320858 RepID=A0A385YVA2_9BACL|nr:ribonuclease H-like domain-containing protein [Paenisporosarcina cavernae]AYC29423.1 exonuclease [Paenisporosarcina cavernae]